MTVFVDTNVFAYALDASNADKRARALHLIDLHRSDLTVSTQVLIELHAVCTRKLGMARADARAAVTAVAGFPVVDTDRQMVLDAMSLAEASDLSVFDAMIVCAAQRARCDVLLTEDLNDGQQFGAVTVRNPFAAD